MGGTNQGEIKEKFPDRTKWNDDEYHWILFPKNLTVNLAE